MRVWLRNHIIKYAIGAALKLSPDPPLPARAMFMAGPFHTAPVDHTVWIGFYHDDTPLPNSFNTASIIDIAGQWVCVNSPAADTLVYVGEPRKEFATPGDFMLTRTGADFVVGVPCSSTQQPGKERPVIGPITCTVIAKRIIGLHDKRVLTAAELLHSLWRQSWQQ